MKLKFKLEIQFGNEGGGLLFFSNNQCKSASLATRGFSVVFKGAGRHVIRGRRHVIGAFSRKQNNSGYMFSFNKISLSLYDRLIYCLAAEAFILSQVTFN